MEFISQHFATLQGASWVLLLVSALLFWFLPALLALVLNRKHFKWILLACIPAGLSFIAWGGLMVWAATGRAVERHRAGLEQES
ncbi:hypothetical protein R50072_12010 [Simiduia litorea]|uniref:superinfection immunity protein n=1 Tax=Simiduia litorea TaxID=1435348 RepID=UPI0036F307D4